MSRVLLIAPTYMNLYEDIITGLQTNGYEVQYYPDKRISGDPFNKVYGGDKRLPVDEFFSQLDSLWAEILAKDPYNGYYDYLLVVDGLSVPPSLFKRLRNANSSIVTCNYLYDRVRGVYELDRNFPYYDRIFSFDRSDSMEYGLQLLPIYWTMTEGQPIIERDLFGFGALDPLRLEIFLRMKTLAERLDESYFIKIFQATGTVPSMLKNSIKAIMRKDHIPLKVFFSGLMTNKALAPEDFRNKIQTSRIILDTNHSYQDGLTARFMWALGAKKKIITTNKAVRFYPFYSKEQIFILDQDWSELTSFIERGFEMSDAIWQEILKYRIDNWLNTILIAN